MAMHRPLWMQPKSGDSTFAYDGLTLRWNLAATWASEGVVGTGFRIAQRAAGANFSVDISGGIAVVTGNDTSTQGTYLVASDATENVAIPSPPPSGTKIYDVVLHVRDALYDGTLANNTYDAIFEVLEDSGGTPIGFPPTAILLGQVSVAAAQVSVTNANITNLQISALTTASWLRQVASDSGRPALPLPGEQTWRTDLKDVETHDGTDWRRLGLNRPEAILTTLHNQNVTTSTTTAVAFESEVMDSHGGHDNVTNNTRYVAPQSGVYRVDAVIPWVNNTVEGKYEMHVRVNGSTTWVAGYAYKGTQNITAISQGGATVRLNQGDYIELLVWQGSGGTRAIDCTFNGGPRMEIIWERPL